MHGSDSKFCICHLPDSSCAKRRRHRHLNEAGKHFKGAAALKVLILWAEGERGAERRPSLLAARARLSSLPDRTDCEPPRLKWQSRERRAAAAAARPLQLWAFAKCGAVTPRMKPCFLRTIVSGSCCPLSVPRHHIMHM